MYTSILESERIIHGAECSNCDVLPVNNAVGMDGGLLVLDHGIIGEGSAVDDHLVVLELVVADVDWALAASAEANASRGWHRRSARDPPLVGPVLLQGVGIVRGHSHAPSAVHQHRCAVLVPRLQVGRHRGLLQVRVGSHPATVAPHGVRQPNADIQRLEVRATPTVAADVVRLDVPAARHEAAAVAVLLHADVVATGRVEGPVVSATSECTSRSSVGTVDSSDDRAAPVVAQVLGEVSALGELMRGDRVLAVVLLHDLILFEVEHAGLLGECLNHGSRVVSFLRGGVRASGDVQVGHGQDSVGVVVPDLANATGLVNLRVPVVVHLGTLVAVGTKEVLNLCALKIVAPALLVRVVQQHVGSRLLHLHNVLLHGSDRAGAVATVQLIEDSVLGAGVLAEISVRRGCLVLKRVVLATSVLVHVHARKLGLATTALQSHLAVVVQLVGAHGVVTQRGGDEVAEDAVSP